MTGPVDIHQRSDEHNSRGIELADRGWLDEAAIEFRKAIEFDPESPHAYANLGTVLATNGKLPDALRAYLEALQKAPDNPATHHYLASFLSAYAQEIADKEYQQTFELDFEFPDAHFNCALSLADRGLADQALEEFRIALEQAPNDNIVEHELAACLIDLGLYPEAISRLKKIVKDFPEHAEAHFDLGIAFTAQGFLEEGERELEHGIKLQPGDPTGYYHLSILKLAQNDTNSALRAIARALEADYLKVKEWLKDDQLFEALRDHPEFRELVQSQPNTTNNPNGEKGK